LRFAAAAPFAQRQQQPGEFVVAGWSAAVCPVVAKGYAIRTSWNGCSILIDAPAIIGPEATVWASPLMIAMNDGEVRTITNCCGRGLRRSDGIGGRIRGLSPSTLDALHQWDGKLKVSASRHSKWPGTAKYWLFPEALCGMGPSLHKFVPGTGHRPPIYDLLSILL
jgi:hypothetical protein